MMKSIYDRIELFKGMVETMQLFGVAVRRREMDNASCLFLTGDQALVKNALALVERYPVLGFRPIKAASYVHHREVYQTATGWAKRPADGIDECKITQKESGVFVCSCLDFRYNLKAIQVARGPPQQPCCHILAAALSHSEILEVFIQYKGESPRE